MQRVTEARSQAQAEPAMTSTLPLDSPVDQPSDNEIVLIDLSSIAHPIWHTTQSDPDPNKPSQQIVARVLDLARGHESVVICCDAGRSFRKDMNAAYKANRPPTEAPLQHQIGLSKERLAREGFPVWSFDGFEADDVIASAATTIVGPASPESLTVLIVTADKDLYQLVGPRVRVKSARDGVVMDADAVGAKFGVRPDQMRDYLTLVGDASDNIEGAKGVGPKNAAKLLAKFGTLDEIYKQLIAVGGAALSIPPAISQSLHAFKNSGAMESSRALVTLRTDVEVPFSDLMKPRVKVAEPSFEQFGYEDEAADEPDSVSADVVSAQAPARVAATDTPPNPEPRTTNPEPRIQSPSLSIARRQQDDIMMPGPAEWERQLDPRSMREARQLAGDMFASAMFTAYGSPQAVLSTVMVGRELGLPAMSSLRCIYNIEGKHSLAAGLMVALVLKSGLAEFFEPISFSETEATFETKRKGARNPVKLQHTFDMAVKAWPKTKADWEKKFNDSGWGRNPTDMLVARAQARLARMVYPDLLAGLYTPDELAEIRLREAA